MVGCFVGVKKFVRPTRPSVLADCNSNLIHLTDIKGKCFRHIFLQLGGDSLQIYQLSPWMYTSSDVRMRYISVGSASMLSCTSTWTCLQLVQRWGSSPKVISSRPGLITICLGEKRERKRKPFSLFPFTVLALQLELSKAFKGR